MIDIPNQSYMIDTYGDNAQSRLAMEECAELIQAINKMSRLNKGYKDYKSAKDNLTEEIADVLIMIEQLKIMYNITDDDIQHWIDYKHERQIKRLKFADQNTLEYADMPTV